MVKRCKERFTSPKEVLLFLYNLKAGTRAFDGFATSSEHRIQGKDVDGNLSFFVKVGEFLNAERVLVFHPRLENRPSAVIPDVPIAVPPVNKPHKYTGNGTALDRQVRHIDFQNIRRLVLRRLGIVGKLRVQDYEVLLLM
ncbi:MAG: hypothetical protein BWY95_02114 [Bacteroidetes bacterium ADurb.BinA104]|nr:MAG: hypothetical protein BWY95_02114 [Bacteroidetes bacterium ADurb.BinA104]